MQAPDQGNSFPFTTSESTVDSAPSVPPRFSSVDQLPPSYDSVSFSNYNNTSTISFLQLSTNRDVCGASSTSGIDTLNSDLGDVFGSSFPNTPWSTTNDKPEDQIPGKTVVCSCFLFIVNFVMTDTNLLLFSFRKRTRCVER